MFRESDGQQSLMSPKFLVGEKKSQGLESTWAHHWRTQVLPLIDERPFARFFHQTRGAPNKPARVVVSLLVFKHLFDLTDDQVIEQFTWNMLWHYALDVDVDQACIERKTLSTWRGYVCELGGAARLFRDITDHLIELEGLRVDIQRVDSTHIVSDIRILSRLGLFTETLTAFLRELRGHTGRIDEVPGAVVERYLEREGYFADPPRSEARRNMQQSARDAVALLHLFQDDDDVCALRHWESLTRLVDEQCIVKARDEQDDDDDEGEGPLVVEVRPKEQIPSDAMRTPHDHDASFGHKGLGYSTQFSETCAKENAFQVITDVDTDRAHRADSSRVEETLQRLETAGCKPETMLADAGYVSARTITEAGNNNVDLVGPFNTGTPPAEELLHLDDFVLDADGLPRECPEGHERSGVEPAKNDGEVLVRFNGETCLSCPRKEQCPVMRSRILLARRNGRELRLRKDPSITIASSERILARRRQLQQTSQFREVYRQRSGIEARNSLMKNCHSLGRPKRVRGLVRMEMAVTFKALASNLRNWFGALSNPRKTPALA
jgi:hypothetical protein